jgi:hypothetical protein
MTHDLIQRHLQACFSLGFRSAMLGAALAAGALPAAATENLLREPFAQWTRLPKEGEFILTPEYTYNYSKRFWKNHDSVDIQRVPQDGFDQNHGGVRADYGLGKDWALDATVAYTSGATRFFSPSRTPHTSMGLADTQLGIRYRLATEGPKWWQANVTVRAGGIVKGTYWGDFPFAPGHGGSGFEPSIGFTKKISRCGFGFYGEAGLRVRDHSVPVTFFASAGASQGFQFSGWARSLTMNFGYNHLQDLSGPDVTGTLTDVTYSRRVKEVVRAVEGSVSLIDHDGWKYEYRMELALDGRNALINTLYGLAISVPLEKH